MGSPYQHIYSVKIVKIMELRITNLQLEITVAHFFELLLLRKHVESEMGQSHRYNLANTK